MGDLDNSAKRVLWCLPWPAMVFGVFVMCATYLVACDAHFFESMKVDPALDMALGHALASTIGHVMASLLLIPIGMVLGIPLWFSGWLIKGRQSLSFRPFVLAGMGITVGLCLCGRMYAESQQRAEREQRQEREVQESLDNFRQDNLSGMVRLEITDCKLITGPLYEGGPISVTGLSGTVVNGSKKTLGAFTLDVWVYKSDGTVIETQTTPEIAVYIPQGQPGKFSALNRMKLPPKGSHWTYKIKSATFL